MANHCTDIICIDCGYTWCGDDGFITGEPLEEIKHRVIKRGIKASDTCSKCNSKNVYHK